MIWIETCTNVFSADGGGSKKRTVMEKNYNLSLKYA